MRSLTGIVNQTPMLDDLEAIWGITEAADEFHVLPRGRYSANAIEGELTVSRVKETLGYRITFEVVEGEYAGKRFWHTIFLTPKSMPQAKRDLAKLGIASMDQLKQPLNAVYLCVVDLTVRQDGDYEGNRVRRFEVIGASQLAPDVFAPESKLPMGTKEALATDSVVQPKAEAVSPPLGRVPKKKKKPFSKSSTQKSSVNSTSVKVKGGGQ